MKKFVCTLLVFSVVFSAAFCVFAAQQTVDIELTQLGSTDTYYSYDADSQTLTISGRGETPNFTNSQSSLPWYNWRGTSVSKVVVEEGVTSIGSYMFYHMRATEFELPSTLRKIGDASFGYAINVEKWDLPFGIKEIGKKAFQYCTGAEQVVLPASVTTVGQEAFLNCTSLTDVTIPESVTSIGKYAFKKCTSLSNVNFLSLTSSVSFGNYAFLGCDSLSHLDIPSNATGGICFFGYEDESTMYDDLTATVYSGSSGENYAVSNDIEVTYFDTVDISCGVSYENIFDDDNMDSEYHYTFTPSADGDYSFFTTGSMDSKGRIENSGTVVAEADDISSSNLNFYFTATIEAGVEYDVFVSSLKATGTTCLVALPSDISTVDTCGIITASAVDSTEKDSYRYFEITDDMLGDLVLTIGFSNGFEYETFYSGGFFNGGEMKYVDNQDDEHFTCGDNTSQISCCSVSADFVFCVSPHSYSEQRVEATEDEAGYTLHTCIVCGEEYKSDFVESTAVQITGQCVMSENPQTDSHDSNTAYSYAYITVDERKYSVSDDGSWSINTFPNKTIDIVFHNSYGKDKTISVTVGNSGFEYGVVALDGYDINNDGYVNARDYALWYRELRDGTGDDYWQFGDSFLINY